jgi:DNA-binding transcriptional ArsR family regulator
MKTGPPNELAINAAYIKNAALLLRAIDHPLRQKILEFAHLYTRVSVTEVHTKFRIEQSVASDHLAILRNAKLVITVREGRFIYYSVNYPQLDKLYGLCSQVIRLTK